MTRQTRTLTVMAVLLACLGTGRGEEIDSGAVADRARGLRRRLMDLDAVARARVLEDRGDKQVRRPPVHAAYNVEEFAPLTARFVRFTVLATRDGSEPCLDALEIYGPDTTDNLARAAKGARVTASSFLPAHPIDQLVYFNDGSGKPGAWVAKDRGKGWAQVELPAAAKIGRVVWSRDASGRYHDRLPSAYRVEVSDDGSVWTTVATGENRVAAGQDPWLSHATLRKAMKLCEQKKRLELLDELKKLPSSNLVAPKSGPQVGEDVSGRFAALFLNGEHAGKKRCPV